jgi:heat shock protein HtpX
MAKYFQTGLLAIYILATTSLVLWIVFLCGLHLSKPAMAIMTTAWGVICVSSFYFQPRFLPFSPLNIRRAVLHEESRLDSCLSEVLSRAYYRGKINLLIGEALTIDAFTAGHNTIVISRGALIHLTEGEIKAVMAHELGHIMSKDTLLLTAFVTATQLPKTVGLLGKIFVKFFRGFVSAGCVPAATCLVIFSVLVYTLNAHHYILSMLFIPFLLFLIGFLEPAFALCWRLGSRFIEYKQDAFAYNLGYGNDLKNALCKISLEQVQPVNLFHILGKSTHPVIYNRIRRLEKMEGLR